MRVVISAAADNYIIFYEATPEALSIERVLDGRRDVRRIIELGIEEPPDPAGAD